MPTFPVAPTILTRTCSRTLVIRIEPSRRVLTAMGYNAMADERSERVVIAGQRQAAALLRRPAMASRLGILTGDADSIAA